MFDPKGGALIHSKMPFIKMWPLKTDAKENTKDSGPWMHPSNTMDSGPKKMGPMTKGKSAKPMSHEEATKKEWAAKRSSDPLLQQPMKVKWSPNQA